VYGISGCFAGMAPMKTTNTGKRMKGEATSSQPPPSNQAFEREREIQVSLPPRQVRSTAAAVYKA